MQWMLPRSWLAISAWFALATAWAWAGTPAVWSGTIDGVATWITVVPRGHDIRAEALASDPWWEWGNATTDAYLFAFEQPDNVRLAVSFSPLANGAPEASIYVNPASSSTTAPISYDLEGDRLRILSAGGHPYLTLRPRGAGAWSTAGVTNYNLTVTRYYDTCDGESWQLDGVPFWKVEVGEASPGVPGWETRRRLLDPHPDRDCRRYGASQRLEDSPPFRVAEPLMPTFPYLGIGTKPGDWYVENQPPIFFDLPATTGFDATSYRLSLFPFVSFHTGGTYWVNSEMPPPKGNFESPFVFYSFDTTSRKPQMIVRNGGSRTGTARFPLESDEQENLIRYSWKTDSDDAWQYGLHLAGFNTYAPDDSITIGGDVLEMPTAERLPHWVVDNAWPVVVFLDAVAPYPGSEGIYFYQPWDQELLSWLHGGSVTTPEALAIPFLPEDRELTATSWEGLPPGFRGEYSATHFRTPRLYLGAMDDRLHLLHAEGGAWNLENGRILRVHNVLADAHIDGWTREVVPDQIDATIPAVGADDADPVVGSEPIVPIPDGDLGAGPSAGRGPWAPRALPGAIEEGLFELFGFMIYTGPSGAAIRRAETGVSRFELSPPTDAASWEAFRERVRPFADAGADAWDLRAWMAPWPGPEVFLASARIERLRANADGFSFVLHRSADAPAPRASGAEGLDSLPPVDGLSAGTYLLSYASASHAWSVAEVAEDPARDLVVELTADVHQFHPARLDLVIRNPGASTWMGDASLSIGDEPAAHWNDLIVGPAERVRLDIPWSSTEDGHVKVQMRLGDRSYALPDLVVRSARRPGPIESLRMSASPALFMLVTLVLLVIVVARLARSRTRGEAS